jgi:hypothetical protein
MATTTALERGETAIRQVAVTERMTTADAEALETFPAQWRDTSQTINGEVSQASSAPPISKEPWKNCDKGLF